MRGARFVWRRAPSQACPERVEGSSQAQRGAPDHGPGLLYDVTRTLKKLEESFPEPKQRDHPLRYFTATPQG